VADIFKKCPSCGKRFEVHRTGETVEAGEKEVFLVASPQSSMSQEMPRNSFSAGSLPEVELAVPPTVEPITAERDTIEDTYTCKHCGHTWTETRESFKKEGGGEIRGKVISEGAP
jgi:ribosomal protein L37AE/L43A